MDFSPTGTLADVVPEARPHFEELIDLADSLGLSPRVVSVGRTCAEQDEKVRAGVSHAPGCRSWHVLGRAIDIMLTPHTCEAHAALGAAWEEMGGIWGGRFPGFGPCGDMGHYQWSETSVPVAECPDPADCEATRLSYLTAEFQSGRASILGKLGWAVIGAALVAGAGYVYWRRR